MPSSRLGLLITRDMRRLGGSLLLACLSTASLHAAEQAATAECSQSLDSAPKTVQATLAPAYADTAKADMKAVSKQMNELMQEIARCQAMSQDHANQSATKQRDVAEWQSLNEWMYRLSSFVDQAARGDHHMDWKREFETFQDVYELKR